MSEITGTGKATTICAHRCAQCGAITTDEPRWWLRINGSRNMANESLLRDASTCINAMLHFSSSMFEMWTTTLRQINDALLADASEPSRVEELASLLSEAHDCIESLLEEPPVTERGAPAYCPDAEQLCAKLEAVLNEIKANTLVDGGAQ